MTNFIRIIICFFFIFISFISAAYADMPIRVMSNSFIQSTTQKNIITIVKQALFHENINIGNNSTYSQATVELLQSKSQRYLLVHLMSRYFFSTEIIRINLSENNSIHHPVIRHYKLQQSDFLAQANNINPSTPACPAQYQTGKPLFVIGTPSYAYYKSVSRSVDALSQAVLNTHQYQLVQLLDQNATVQNYQNILMCPNLKYFAHFGGSDDYGQSFPLTDGDFAATYFSQNPSLNLNDKALSFDSCNLFDQVDHGFCPILSHMQDAPAAFTSGSSQLLIFGSAETYACFWEKVLQGFPITQSTLNHCAITHDPSVSNSESGIYFLGDHSDNAANELIQTNQREITIAPNGYTVLKLNKGEIVTQYAIQNINSAQAIVCTPDPTNRISLLNNPNLNSGEFVIGHNDGNTCQFTDISRMARNGNITRDIYGFNPGESCFHLPNNPPIGNLSLSSNAGLVDMSCNGIKFNGYNIDANSEEFSWPSFILSFDNSKNLDCTFNLDKTKTEIASLHINIQPSSTLPGVLSGQISNVKSMNNYPLPTITYSDSGNALNYHDGIGIVLNSGT